MWVQVNTRTTLVKPHPMRIWSVRFCIILFIVSGVLLAVVSIGQNSQFKIDRTVVADGLQAVLNHQRAILQIASFHHRIRLQRCGFLDEGQGGESSHCP